MDYNNTNLEKIRFGKFLKGIPKGARFRIIVSLCLLTDQSYSKWHRKIRMLIDEDTSVEIKLHEGRALLEIMTVNDPNFFFYNAANALKRYENFQMNITNS